MNFCKFTSKKVPEYRVVILGAGKNVRGDLPSAMVNVDPSHHVLDWLLSLFEDLSSVEVNFVAGYKANIIMDQYPNMNYFFNPEWGETGPVRSLAKVPLLSQTATYISYSDVVFRKDVISRMEKCSADVTLAVDTLWRERYEAPSRMDIDLKEKIQLEGGRVLDMGKHLSANEASAQFTGLVRISGSKTECFQEILRRKQFQSDAKLSEAMRFFVKNDFSSETIDLKGQWAELDAPQDLARFVLGTKAESLERLRPLVRKGKIEEQVSFTLTQWKDSPEEIIGKIRNEFKDAQLIVRSSALSEDNWDRSYAGIHESVLNVSSKNRIDIECAVEKVFDSYHQKLGENQVLVQEMISDVKLSGVVLTRTPSLAAPYYVINFDDTSERTDTVTSGDGKNIRTVFLHRNAKVRQSLPRELDLLIEAVKELEKLVGHDSLDVEFAFTEKGTLHILQIRPIAASHLSRPIDDVKIAESIRKGIKYFHKLQRARPLLAGDSSSFSVMADWNPAEMIGTKPNPLAFSLYRYLITDETWARQRAEYGYRDVRPANLIVDFLGHPYVDIRVDFNSFIPESLPEELAGRLVNYYAQRLKKHPEFHDKVEFEILHTSITFDFDKRSRVLTEAGFSKTDICLLRESFIKITTGGIARCQSDLDRLQESETRYRKIMAKVLSPLERAYFLLEDARRLGVLHFSHLARNAFVSVNLLKSLEVIGVTTKKQTENFISSIRIIPDMMREDAEKVTSGNMKWEEFVDKYGHLRPGSYDITSACYAEAPDEFLRPMLNGVCNRHLENEGCQVWDEKTLQGISMELAKSGLNVDIKQFENFLRKSIEGRELGKFIFTRNLNAALVAIAEFAGQYNISREDISFVKIKEILGLRGAKTEPAGDILRRFAGLNKEDFNVTQAVSLPNQIFSETDFVCMEQLKTAPNFITQKKINARIVSLTRGNAFQEELSGKIIVIPSADPGFDWVFSRRIAALITMYGGANSHMAIRAAESGLPAAIGIGESLFEKINHAEMLELDCGGRRIEIIR